MNRIIMILGRWRMLLEVVYLFLLNPWLEDGVIF